MPRFVDPPFISTGVFGTGMVTADFNGDGIPDAGSIDRNADQIGLSLGNGDSTFQPTQIYNVGNGPTDMKTADLNGDGIPDLVVSLGGQIFAYNRKVVVLLGNDDGTFGNPTNFEAGLLPSSVAVADLNEDGKIDVVVSTRGRMQGVTVLLGNGDGTLQPPVTYGAGDNPATVILADFNADGYLDAAVVNLGSATFSILFGNGDGTFGTAVSYPTQYSDPRDLAVADLNQDSRPDVAVSYYFTGIVSVFLASSDGTFQAAIDTATGFYYTQNLRAADLDGNSIPDLVTGSGALTVLLGKGDGTFEPPVGYHMNGGVATLGQFDGTGGVDALASESRDVAGFTFLAGNGDGTFNAPRSFPTSPIPVLSAASADLDQNGKPDLVVAGYSTSDGQGQVSVFLNTGHGLLAPRVDYLTGNLTTEVTSGDLNHDGLPDLVAANHNDDSVSVLLGTGGGLFQNATNYATGDGPWSVVIADFNRDRTKDLATVNDAFRISVLIGAGGGSFPTHTELYTGLSLSRTIAAGDLDGDGNPDLAVIGVVLGQPLVDVVSVYLGNGDGTFNARTDYQLTTGAGLQARVKIADVDGDTKPDLVAANFGIDVFLNNGDGTFRGPVTTAGVSLSLGSLQSGDIDGNGSLDLVLGTYSSPNGNGLFLGNGDGTFSPSEHFFKFGVATALADFNNDGALDVAETGSSATTILFNTGGSHVSLLSSENPSDAGEKVTFHARVTPTVSSAVPSGTVEFLDGDQTLGTAVLVDGKARLSTSSLSVGRHRIRANYSGDAIFVPTKSKAKRQVVQP